ncbi:hypothetical protein FE697_000425 [Mumia zhuanghuii]|uniref:ABC transporter n=2 Tax=Mumia TaxID=1546255 RepID=A0ABW1QU02_9ACTN|nr:MULTISPECIES: hypothetical protein [Mumia]KAA1424436.1 hypothetical protein FE697_000425 [Mumia zhuanghuii]
MRTRTAAAALALALALTSCATDPPGAVTPPESGHGEAEGATEEAEAQHRVVVAEPGGDLAVIDLLDESVEIVTAGAAVRGLTTDGRFAYARTDDGLSVVDAGTWTWPHGDHNHYYRGAVQDLGRHDLGDGHVDGAFGLPTVAFDDDTGTAVVVDRAPLEEGEVSVSEPIGRGPTHHGFALALGDRVLVSTTSGDELPDGITSYDLAGRSGTALDLPCTDLHGAARVGEQIVVGCDSGALVVDGVRADLVPYPQGTPAEERAWSFAHRPRSTELAAVRGSAGAWSLDVADRRWTRVDSPGAVAATALGAGAGTLTLDAGGTVRHFDNDGVEVAANPLLDRVDPLHAPTIAVDAARAYVNDAARGVVHEIDWADGLRVARALGTGDVSPTYLVETGW